MKILICDPISSDAIAKMREACLEVDVRDDISPEALMGVIDAYDAVVVRSRTKVREPLIDEATNLKIIVRGGVGLDNIDVKYARAKGIRVMNTAAASSYSVAELAIAYMLALARPIVQATASMKAGKWEKKRFKGSEIQGKTLGIIGMGRIGMAVATRAAALDMLVLGYDSQSIGPAPFMTMVPLDELFARSDYITLHTPLTEATHHMIGADAIAKMRDGVCIIDCARGGVVDEDALYDGIVAGKVAGAALDVFEIEPASNNKLLTLEQVIASPHIGASTSEATARIGGEVAKILIEFSQEPCD